MNGSSDKNKPAKRLQKISVFGLGPVGLVTAICFAKRGYRVIGVDPDTKKLQLIRKGTAPFYEPSINDYLNEAIKTGTLTVTDDSASNSESDFTYITVGTPSKEQGEIDLTYVKNAAADIGRSIRKTGNYQLVIVKSTVIPGTSRNVVKSILERESGKTLGPQFGLCSNPEFLREGNAIIDSEFPDRIVIGAENEDDLNRLEKLYREFYGEATPVIIRTSYENAELTKYANNSFLAMKVSYINMIANLCQKIQGGDVEDVAKGIGLDARIGPLFLRAGLGWGGSCFPKDLKAISSFGKSINVETLLVDAAIDLNNHQPLKAVELAENLAGKLDGKKIAVLGLAFKPDTDDMREAVSIPIIKALISKGAKIAAYDPSSISNARSIFQGKIDYSNNVAECISNANCCILVTEWTEFKSIPPRMFLEKMKQPLLIDGRRVYDPKAFMKAGVRFAAVGLAGRS